MGRPIVARSIKRTRQRAMGIAPGPSTDPVSSAEHDAHVAKGEPHPKPKRVRKPRK